MVSNVSKGKLQDNARGEALWALLHHALGVTSRLLRAKRVGFYFVELPSLICSSLLGSTIAVHLFRTTHVEHLLQ